MAILPDDARLPTEQFRTLEQRISEEAAILMTCLDGHTRLKLPTFVALMYHYKMISIDDLEGFSEELRDRIAQHPGF